MIFESVKKLSDVLSRPVMLHYALPVLMAYLVAGTVAQKYIGLYAATRMFFSAPVLWLGPVPLPGLPVLMALIFLSLVFKLAFKSEWRFRRAGVILTHIGVILLFFGGFLTVLTGREGFVDLAPGDVKGFVTDYHARSFVVLDETGGVVARFAHNRLATGEILSSDALPFSMRVLETCRNCKIRARGQDDSGAAYQGMAVHMALSDDALRAEDEENMGGLVFALEGSETDGAYLVLEGVLKWPEITADGVRYRFALRKDRRALPFTVELLEFRRDMHPGTAMARAYSSRVRIHDGGAQWEALISMNEPLRYKGYTLFQSSFIETPQGDVSVLAVVWNAGRVFPYVSGLLICAGLVFHLFARRRRTHGPVSEGGPVYAA